MKYATLVIVAVAAILHVTVPLFAQDLQGADNDELEMLKKAWQQYRKEKLDENPDGLDSESGDVLQRLQRLMRAIEQKLSRLDPGEETLEKQREALDLLDRMIEEQPQIPGSSGSEDEEPAPPGASPGGLLEPGGLDDSSKPEAKPQKVEKTEEEKEKTLPKENDAREGEWNPRLQSKVSMKDYESGANEERPAKYEALIDRYYKELLKPEPGK